MPRESTIRIYRSDTAGTVPSLTAGELAINIPDSRLFVGNSTGGVIPFFGNGVTGVNGITGAVTLTSGSGITITQSGKQITLASSVTQYTAPLATSSITGVASFRAADFDVSTTGSVSLIGNVARTNVAQTFATVQGFAGGFTAAGATFTNAIYAPNMVTGVNGITGAVSITSGSNITITQSGKQITIASSGGGLVWSVVTADQSITINTGTFANKSSGTLTLTLPTTAAVGTSIRVSGMQNTWRIAQNASQIINFGKVSTTTGTGGYLESTNARDSVELVCCVADTQWNVVSSIGNITIV